MWDHETQSLWQQFTGEAIVGTLNGTRLEQIPSLVVSWGEFKDQFPDGQVLHNIRGSNPLTRVSYAGYDNNNDSPFLFRDEIDDRLIATERVLGYFGAEGGDCLCLSSLGGSRCGERSNWW